MARTLMDLPETITHAVARRLSHMDRAALALTCKAALPLLLETARAKVSSRTADLANQILGFNKCLELYPNHITALQLLNANAQDVTMHFHLPPPVYGRLQSLEILEQLHVPVDLHALASIAPQLRALVMRECRLTCRDDFSAFGSGFANLKMLDLKDSVLHARLGAVNLPSLTRLSLPGFAAQLPDWPQSEPSMDCIEAFARGGCPQCTHLAFRPIWHEDEDIRTVPCKPFGTLTSVQLEFNVWHTRHPTMWPAPLPQLDLPVGVTSLTCAGLFAVASQYCNGGDDLDLFAMLSIAARSIEAGVHLRKLCCKHCATCIVEMIDEEDGTVFEPDEAQHATLYQPLCSRLHGLEQLDLSKSPNAQQYTVDTIVQFAPDLVSLEVMVNWEPGWPQKSTMYCAGLRELIVHYRLGSQRSSSEPLALKLDLNACDSLDAFFIHGLYWEPMSQDRFTVALECHAGAIIEADAVESDGYWTLRCFFEGRRHERQVTVSYLVGRDLAWSASVQEGALA